MGVLAEGRREVLTVSTSPGLRCSRSMRTSAERRPGRATAGVPSSHPRKLRPGHRNRTTGMTPPTLIGTHYPPRVRLARRVWCSNRSARCQVPAHHPAQRQGSLAVKFGHQAGDEILPLASREVVLQAILDLAFQAMSHVDCFTAVATLTISACGAVISGGGDEKALVLQRSLSFPMPPGESGPTFLVALDRAAIPFPSPRRSRHDLGLFLHPPVEQVHQHRPYLGHAQPGSFSPTRRPLAGQESQGQQGQGRVVGPPRLVLVQPALALPVLDALLDPLPRRPHPGERPQRHRRRGVRPVVLHLRLLGERGDERQGERTPRRRPRRCPPRSAARRRGADVRGGRKVQAGRRVSISSTAATTSGTSAIAPEPISPQANSFSIGATIRSVFARSLI